MHWRRKWQPTRVLAWRIPGSGEPGGLPSMGLHRVGHDWSDLAAAVAASSYCVHPQSLQSCLTVCDPMDSSLPGSSVRGLFSEGGIAMSSSRRSSQPGDWNLSSWVSCTVGRFFTSEPLGKVCLHIIELQSYLGILYVIPELEVWFANIFSQSIACLFVFLMMSFEGHTFLILINSIIFFYFMNYTFDIICKKSSLNQKS